MAYPDLPDIPAPLPPDPLAPPPGPADAVEASMMSGSPEAEPVVAPTILTKTAEADILRIGDMNRERSRRVRWEREAQNRKNWDFVHMRQDWSSKIDGQSKVFFPDLPMSLYQQVATIENQLVNFQNWFSVENLGGLSVFDNDTLRQLMQYMLNRLWRPGDEPETSLKFPQFLADSLFVGLVESEITWKVFGVDSERVTYMLESAADLDPGESALIDDHREFDDPEWAPARTYERASYAIKKAFIRTFRLGIDLIPFEDSFPDPSPLNLFHIHEVTRHVSELRANPDYDPDVVRGLIASAGDLEAMRSKAARSGVSGSRLLGDDPNQVRVREYWGDLVDPSTGDYKYRNCFFTTCNGRLLRPPTPNPRWDQNRPLIRSAVLRTPLSPVHKALMDHAVPSAEAENEIGSLMLDGGIASVWGTRQARPELLADPTSISKGVPPSFTAVLKRGAPPNVKFLERVDEGQQTPQYAMDMLLRMGRAREIGLAVPSYQNGALPPRQVQATEAVLASESSDNLFENIASHLEQSLIEPALQLVWSTIWQGLDDFTAPELVQILGPERAVLLQTLETEERFYLFSNGTKFEVKGLRSILQRINEFRKLTTVTQLVTGSPLLQQAFVQVYDPARIVEKAIRAVNIDPTEIEWRASDAQRRAELLMTLTTPVKPQIQAPATNGGSPYNPPGMTPQPGESSIEGEFAPPNPLGNRGTQF